MPTRMVRASLLESDRWLGLPHPVERLAYVVLLLVADDLGTLEASDGQLVRLWRDTCNLKGREDALRILESLADADLVRPYADAGKRLLFIPRFRQRFRAESIRRPPPPENLLHDEPEVLENIRRIRAKEQETLGSRPSSAGQPTDNCPSPAPEGVVVVVGEGEGGKKARSRFQPPSLEALQAYITENGYRVDAQRFLDHYASNGWKVGRNSMQDWQAAVRTWHNTETQRHGSADWREKAGIA